MSNRNIQYLNKDFSSIKEQLIEYAKNYFPDTYTDFSPASPGMMFIEMVAYVGDILSFYQDVNVQETFLQYAKNPASLYSLAYMLGYRPKVTSAAITTLQVTQLVSADGSGIPDLSKTYRIGEGTTIGGTAGMSFITRDTVDFSISSSADSTTITEVSSSVAGVPLEYQFVKNVEAYSGKIKTITKTFNEYQKYQTFVIEDSNIISILSAKEESTGNVWYEVPFLGQDTIYESGSLSGNAYTLNLTKVSRRFVTRFTKDGYLQVQFGAGMFAEDEDEKTYLPDPLALATSVQEQSSERYDAAYDPSNFLFSNSYGLAPSNTSITFTYVTGGGVESNVDSNTLTRFVDTSKISLASGASGSVDMTRLSVTNPNAASGGKDGDSVEDIRQNALRSFAEQKRMVTLDDYAVRALAMPAKYGSIAKAYATNNPDLFYSSKIQGEKSSAIALYVLCYDNANKLVAPDSTVCENLKKYLSQYMMISDLVYIRNAFVINLGIQYDIVLKSNYTSTTVLEACNKALAEYLDTKNRNINAVLYLSDLSSILSQVAGVQSVKEVKVVDKGGNDGYSLYTYDVAAATRNGVLYPSYDPCIFEVKYPEIDIQGRVTTI